MKRGVKGWEGKREITRGKETKDTRTRTKQQVYSLRKGESGKVDNERRELRTNGKGDMKSKEA